MALVPKWLGPNNDSVVAGSFPIGLNHVTDTFMNADCEWFKTETANVITGSFPFLQNHLAIARVVGVFAHSDFINVALLFIWAEVGQCQVCVSVGVYLLRQSLLQCSQCCVGIWGVCLQRLDSVFQTAQLFLFVPQLILQVFYLQTEWEIKSKTTFYNAYFSNFLKNYIILANVLVLKHCGIYLHKPRGCSISADKQ